MDINDDRTVRRWTTAERLERLTGKTLHRNEEDRDNNDYDKANDEFHFSAKTTLSYEERLKDGFQLLGLAGDA